MNTELKVKEYVKNWMDGHEPDTFPKNEHGVSIFSNGETSLNIKSFFEDLLTEFTDDNYSQLLKQRDDMRQLLKDGIDLLSVKCHKGCEIKNWNDFENGNGKSVGMDIEKFIKQSKKLIESTNP